MSDIGLNRPRLSSALWGFCGEIPIRADIRYCLIPNVRHAKQGIGANWLRSVVTQALDRCYNAG
ncbi:hypothetical protein [Pleionea mediterranea]|uniref:hypothetical protein n=1 Tax=Pleionea mediterranea TaxID=523701 RepID=UPI0011B27613|nr:hypothetical protein [Pleionea mediterranea]